MLRIFRFLSLALISRAAFARNECHEQSLVHFFSGGREVASQVIGADDPCDHFGGNLAYSPKYQRYVYVNFNIPGNIDLDAVDSAYEKAPSSGQLHDAFARVQLAVVDKSWIKKHYDDNREAVLNLAGDTLFVSERVLEEGRFTALLEKFYGSH